MRRPMHLALVAGLAALATALILRAPASADEAGDREPIDIAVCDIVGLTEEVYLSDRFLKPREEFEESLWPADLKAKRRELEELEKRLREMDEDSPEYEDAYGKWDELSDVVWQKENEISDQVSDRETRDRNRAFNLVVATAAEIAEESGHRYVALGGAPKPLADDADIDAVERTLRYRVFLSIPIFPPDADITEDVRFELGLK